MVQTGKVKKPPAQTVTNENNWSAGLEELRLGRRHLLRRADEREHEVARLVLAEVLHARTSYTVPTTWEDLIALSSKIAADNNGAKPWCGGISSGTASGWPATDWLEEAVLGTYGGQVYDDWISHKVKFNSPQIQAAMQHRRELHAEPGVGQRRLRRRQDHRHHHVPERRPADPEEQVRDAAAGVVLRGAVAEGHDRLARPATRSRSTCRR